MLLLFYGLHEQYVHAVASITADERSVAIQDARSDAAGTLGIPVSFHKLFQPGDCIPVHLALHETRPTQ